VKNRAFDSVEAAYAAGRKMGRKERRAASAKASGIARCPDCGCKDWSCGHADTGTVACLTGAVQFDDATPSPTPPVPRGTR